MVISLCIWCLMHLIKAYQDYDDWNNCSSWPRVLTKCNILILWLTMVEWLNKLSRSHKVPDGFLSKGHSKSLIFNFNHQYTLLANKTFCRVKDFLFVLIFETVGEFWCRYRLLITTSSTHSVWAMCEVKSNYSLCNQLGGT